MERGANNFPFHNLLPYSESNECLFLFFSPSLNWIKEKVGGDSCYPHICDTKISKSVHRITQTRNPSLMHIRVHSIVCLFSFTPFLQVLFFECVRTHIPSLVHIHVHSIVCAFGFTSFLQVLVIGMRTNTH